MNDGAVSPGAFWSGIELNDEFGVDSAERMWRWITVNNACGPIGRDVPALFTGDRVVYRGQANADYGLTSSLYRLCRTTITSGKVSEASLAAAEYEIIRALRAEGIGRLMSDGEMLTVLQHHGIPTRLIDVSKSPIEALFFACDRDEASDGRLFVIDCYGGNRINLKKRTLQWASAALGPANANNNWTQTLDVERDVALDPRMRAQQGRFLVGGLNRRSNGRSMRVGGVEVAPDRYADFCSVGVNFVRQRRDTVSQWWPARGWTMRVENSWKPYLMDRLSTLPDPITTDTMYPPLGEVRRLALKVARDRLSLS